MIDLYFIFAFDKFEKYLCIHIQNLIEKKHFLFKYFFLHTKIEIDGKKMQIDNYVINDQNFND